MIYLLDSNVLIDADRDYYPMDRVQPFWLWLEKCAKSGLVKVPREIHDEVTKGKGEVSDWLKKKHIKECILLEEEPQRAVVAQVISAGYAADLKDDELEKLGKDPFLISYALAEVKDRCVVTTEVSKPKKIRANRHIPDVCQVLGVRSCNTFQLLRDLDFRV